MSKKTKHRGGKPQQLRMVRQRGFATHADSHRAYERACRLAESGRLKEARQLLDQLHDGKPGRLLTAKIENALAVIDAVTGDFNNAGLHLSRALEAEPSLDVGLANRSVLQNEISKAKALPAGERSITKVAIVSLLFNWPSTGGGTIHTAETGKFLARAGYEVKHFFARYPEWGVGRVDEPLEHAAVPICFEANNWNAAGIRRQFAKAVDEFSPDAVIVTDSWNTKPLLAEAVSKYPYFLRLAALECLCPLNNVRMLFDESGRSHACPKNQLSTPDVCRNCVRDRARFSGALHEAERRLAGFEEPDYAERLLRAVRDAAAVLVVNPLIAEMVRPVAQRVEVIPSGFDPARFPWPWPQPEPRDLKQIFFAGLIEEAMKGFHVLHEAGQILWSKRQDFEIIATADPPGRLNEFTRSVGWLSQTQLPAAIRSADILAFPTVAEEALGRSAVEAMAVGRPVVASRIGGLQFTIEDGATGLLFEAGNATDLASKLERLLDDTGLRERLGSAGRRRFEESYLWDTIIERHYQPLLAAVKEARG